MQPFPPPRWTRRRPSSAPGMRLTSAKTWKKPSPSNFYIKLNKETRIKTIRPPVTNLFREKPKNWRKSRKISKIRPNFGPTFHSYRSTMTRMTKRPAKMTNRQMTEVLMTSIILHLSTWPSRTPRKTHIFTRNGTKRMAAEIKLATRRRIPWRIRTSIMNIRSPSCKRWNVRHRRSRKVGKKNFIILVKFLKLKKFV